MKNTSDYHNPYWHGEEFPPKIVEYWLAFEYFHIVNCEQAFEHASNILVQRYSRNISLEVNLGKFLGKLFGWGIVV